jgi:transposase-like protein
MSDKTPARRYTPDDKRRGLIAYLATGNLNQAAETSSIPASTIKTWRDRSETELYSQLSRELGAQIDEQITAQVRETVVSLGQIERKLIARLDDEVDSIHARDLPNALKSVADAKAKSTDKMLLLTGRATDRVEHIDARDLLTDIQRIVQPYVNSTAEEDTAA